MDRLRAAISRPKRASTTAEVGVHDHLSLGANRRIAKLLVANGGSWLDSYVSTYTSVPESLLLPSIALCFLFQHLSKHNTEL